MDNNKTDWWVYILLGFSILCFLNIIISCGGSPSMQDRPPESTPKPEKQTPWETYMTCLQKTDWYSPDLIEPDVFLVDLPCGRPLGGCLANPFNSPKGLCVGEVELYTELAYNEDGTENLPLWIHEYAHSVLLQTFCGCNDLDLNVPDCPEGGLVDSQHTSELYNDNFICHPEKFNEK